MIMQNFTAYLNAPLEADANFLPLSNADYARLKALVPVDEEIYLTVKDELYSEWVLLENKCDSFVLTRGVSDSVPRRFPKGSCVYFEPSVPVIKWLICNHECCVGDCPCDPVTASGVSSTPGTVGTPWDGVAIFSGELPMELSASGIPTWAQAEIGANFIRIYGTPTSQGITNVAVAATNCSGKLATQLLAIDIR